MTDTYDGRPPPIIPGNGGGYQGPPPIDWNQPAPKKSKMWILLAGIGVLALVLLCAGLAVALGNSKTTDPKPQKSSATNSQRVVPPASAKPLSKVVEFSDRDTPALVGQDVPAGVYRVTKNIDDVDGLGCYYTKSKDSEGQDIISNDFLEVGRPQVTLKKGQWFHSQNCGTWQVVK